MRPAKVKEVLVPLSLRPPPFPVTIAFSSIVRRMKDSIWSSLDPSPDRDVEWSQGDLAWSLCVFRIFKTMRELDEMPLLRHRVIQQRTKNTKKYKV